VVVQALEVVLVEGLVVEVAVLVVVVAASVVLEQLNMKSHLLRHSTSNHLRIYNTMAWFRRHL
jgi:hypothetical protein